MLPKMISTENTIMLYYKVHPWGFSTGDKVRPSSVAIQQTVHMAQRARSRQAHVCGVPLQR